MSQYSELKQVLQTQLNWHGARLSFLALFLLALLKVKTVNLSDLCLGFGGKALPPIELQAVAAVFREFDLDYTQLAHLVVRWRQIPLGWVLSLDRTTWKFGNHWDNILTLGIVYEGVA
ncbi:MAG: IS4 family transposase, partial [Cyanobacteria bacterium CRU_2_1]|nr:IS4 family transposase [Cyanobacteria bacterium CRU_2_1]